MQSFIGRFCVLYTFFILRGYDVSIKRRLTMTTKNKWLIGAGIALGLIILFALPFIWQAFFPSVGYGMMGGYGRGPMMGGGYPMHGGAMFGFGFGFMWLIPLALLTLLGLSIAALIKYLRSS
jgi:hypothetical protein